MGRWQIIRGKLDLKITWGTTSIIAWTPVFKAIVFSVDASPATQCRFVSDRCYAESFLHEATRQDGDAAHRSHRVQSQRIHSLETQRKQRRKWWYTQHNGEHSAARRGPAANWCFPQASGETHHQTAANRFNSEQFFSFFDSSLFSEAGWTRAHCRGRQVAMF